MLSKLARFSRFLINPHTGHSSYATLLVFANFVLLAAATYAIIELGETLTEIDRLDVLIESLSTLIHFFLFAICAYLRLRRSIRLMLLVGLFCTQMGMHLDMLDEFINLDGMGWHIWGDAVYLIGLVIVALATYRLSMVAYEASTQDKLTGVFNRRHFDMVLQHYLMKYKRAPFDISLLCLDLDNFKALNDTFGHAMGDEALKVVGEVLHRQARDSDIVCRSGGEEFEILMPDTSAISAVKGAERLLNALRESTPSSLPALTASVGVTAVRPDDTEKTLRQRADQAMYCAKRAGKDRVFLGD